jgi:hypothetical protein
MATLYVSAAACSSQFLNSADSITSTAVARLAGWPRSGELRALCAEATKRRLGGYTLPGAFDRRPDPPKKSSRRLSDSGRNGYR